VPGDRVADGGLGRRGAILLLGEPPQRGHRDVVEAAGGEPVEHAEVGVDVEGEPVAGDAAADPHADRGDLAVVGGPDADQARRALGRVPADRGEAERGEGADEPVLQPAHDVAGPAPVQVLHEVADELPGIVGSHPRSAGRSRTGVDLP